MVNLKMFIGFFSVLFVSFSLPIPFHYLHLHVQMRKNQEDCMYRYIDEMEASKPLIYTQVRKIIVEYLFLFASFPFILRQILTCDTCIFRTLHRGLTCRYIHIYS